MAGPVRKPITQYYRWLTLAVFSVGVALLVTSLIEPSLPIQIISLIFPNEPAQDANLLHISQRLLLTLYGIAAVFVAASMRLAERLMNSTRRPLSEILHTSPSLHFLTLLSFSATFLSVRAIVAISGIVGAGATGTVGGLPVIQIALPGFRVHHYVFGVLILAFICHRVLFNENYSEKLIAILYGAGLGLFIDEIGLILTQGDYFTASTYIFVTVFAAVFLAGIYLETRSQEKMLE